ncbi:hypothetical protein ACFWZT_01445 [Streptomyces alboflavus]|uniref:hypothetical protein n=1 Tax=Streptomyces alboflavus TaxID=67267 RepID=UPI0036915F31
MSPQVTFIGFAEGAIFDARGQLALVGFCPQANVVERFPAQVTPSLIVIIDDDDEGKTLKLGRTANVRIVVTNEAGEVVFYVEQSTPVAELKKTGLPGRLALAAQFPITASKAGRYTYQATIRIAESDAAPLTAEASLRVVDQDWIDARVTAAEAS